MIRNSKNKSKKAYKPHRYFKYGKQGKHHYIMMRRFNEFRALQRKMPLFYDGGLLSLEEQSLPAGLHKYRRYRIQDSRFHLAYKRSQVACQRLVQIYCQDKKYDKALKILADSTKFCQSQRQFNYGKINALQGNYEKALHCFNKMIQIDPTFAEVYLHKSLILAKLKRFKQANRALEAYEKRQDIKFDWYECMEILFYQYGNLDKFYHYCNLVLEQQPQNVDILQKLGATYFYLRNWEKAAYFLQRYLRINQNAQYLYWLARCFMYLKQFGKSLQCGYHTLEIDQNNGYCFRLGLEYLNRDDYKQAFQIFTYIQKKYPHLTYYLQIPQQEEQVYQKYATNINYVQLLQGSQSEYSENKSIGRPQVAQGQVYPRNLNKLNLLKKFPKMFHNTKIEDQKSITCSLFNLSDPQTLPTSIFMPYYSFLGIKIQIDSKQDTYYQQFRIMQEIQHIGHFHYQEYGSNSQFEKGFKYQLSGNFEEARQCFIKIMEIYSNQSLQKWQKFFSAFKKIFREQIHDDQSNITIMRYAYFMLSQMMKQDGHISMKCLSWLLKKQPLAAKGFDINSIAAIIIRNQSMTETQCSQVQLLPLLNKDHKDYDPKSKEAIIGKTYMLAAAKRYQEAIDILEKQKKLNEYQLVLKMLGQLSYKMGSTQKSLYYYQRILMVKPKDEQILSTIGKIYFQENNFEPAKQNLKNALLVNPKNKINMSLLRQCQIFCEEFNHLLKPRQSSSLKLPTSNGQKKKILFFDNKTNSNNIIVNQHFQKNESDKNLSHINLSQIQKLKKHLDQLTQICVYSASARHNLEQNSPKQEGRFVKQISKHINYINKIAKFISIEKAGTKIKGHLSKMIAFTHINLKENIGPKNIIYKIFQFDHQQMRQSELLAQVMSLSSKEEKQTLVKDFAYKYLLKFSLLKLIYTQINAFLDLDQQARLFQQLRKIANQLQLQLYNAKIILNAYLQRDKPIYIQLQPISAGQILLQDTQENTDPSSISLEQSEIPKQKPTQHLKKIVLQSLPLHHKEKQYDTFRKILMKNLCMNLVFLSSKNKYNKFIVQCLQTKDWKDRYVEKGFYVITMRGDNISKIDQHIVQGIWKKGKKYIYSWITSIACAIQEIQDMGLFHCDIEFRNTVLFNDTLIFMLIDFDYLFKVKLIGKEKAEVNAYENMLSLLKQFARLKKWQWFKIIRFLFRPFEKRNEKYEEHYVSDFDYDAYIKAGSQRIRKKKNKIQALMSQLEQYSHILHFLQFERLVWKLLNPGRKEFSNTIIDWKLNKIFVCLGQLKQRKIGYKQFAEKIEAIKRQSQ